MREHLDVTKSDRGFNFMPPIAGGYGGAVKVYESSGATAPHIWLQATNPEGQEVHLHLAAEDAWHLAEQISHLVEHHYQGDARPAAVTPEPAGPRELSVWRIVAGKPGHRGNRFRENNGTLEVLGGDGVNDWLPSRWRSLDELRADGYTLTEVPAVPPAEPGAGA